MPKKIPKGKGAESLHAPRDELEIQVQQRTAALRDINWWLQQEIAQRKCTEVALQEARDKLESRVRERTAELIDTIDLLQVEILQRQLAEEKLKQSQERYWLLIHHSIDAIYLYDLDTHRVLEGNPAFLGFLGYSKEETANLTVYDFVAHERASIDHYAQHLLERGTAAIGDRLWRCKDGTLMHVQVNATMIRQGGREIGVVIARDITERKRAEEALQRANEELERRSRQVIQAQEAERRRVARELHDGVNQLLSSVKFRLQSIMESSFCPKEVGWSEIDKVKILLEQAIKEVRHISQNLRPSVLDELGLQAAVRSLCEEFRERTNIGLELRCSQFPERLSGEVELALYRIIQEALSNVERHSRATHVELLLERKESDIQVKIMDDGSGFNDKSADRKSGDRQGLGLGNMEERATIVGGTLIVNSRPHVGTEIAVNIPLIQGGGEIPGE